MRKHTRNPHQGSSFDCFLESLPSDEQVDIKASALKLELSIKARELMKRRGIGPRKLEKLLRTSPSQVQRLLNERYVGVSLKNLVRLYSALGQDLKLVSR